MTTFRTLAHVRHHGMDLVDYEFTVPLDHDRPAGEALTIFARAVKNSKNTDATRPWLVFLQGGPGFGGPRPLKNSDWLKRALDDYHVLLLDSRGNSRSSVVLPQTLCARGDARAQADYLMRFRADTIVKDAESIRRELVGEEEPWSVLGQSYGGFCAVTYLSLHPEGLREVFITGGLPPLDGHPDDYYRHTYPAVARKTQKFFARYPGDRELCARIMEHLHRHDVALPTGGRLTVRRFQQLGFVLGFDDGMENLHYLLENAFCRGVAGDEISLPFLRELENSQSFETHPIFAVLHEMCYTQEAAANWSAQRVRGEFPDTEWAPGQTPSFTGEMIYPWMFDDYPGLRPLRDVAELLAREARWPRLYDAAQLARNEVPGVAAIYADDMYVPRALSERTAEAIPGLKVWLTNEYEHNGLRSSDGAVFERLVAMRRDLV
jgi:pimeloyl-ACP methyl ester carboxylesterase